MFVLFFLVEKKKDNIILDSNISARKKNYNLVYKGYASYTFNSKRS